MEPFIDSVKALHHANGTEARREEFKRFVNEFGTHYAATTEMGTKLSIERRYVETDYAGLVFYIRRSKAHVVDAIQVLYPRLNN